MRTGFILANSHKATSFHALIWAFFVAAKMLSEPLSVAVIPST